MENYVKFRRGTPEAYKNLVLKDDDTLYFIVDQSNDNVQLYLGSKLISDGQTSNGENGDLILSLGDLQDTDIKELADKQILIYDSVSGTWINTNYRNLIEEFVGATENSTGVSGLVPAPGEGNTNLFLRSDGKWVPIEQIDNEITLTGENPISIDENGVIKLLTDNTTIGVIEKGLSIIGFEDANIGAIPTKTENGLEWIIPEASRDEEFAEDIETLNVDVAALKTLLGTPAEYDEDGNEITAASGAYAEISELQNVVDVTNEAVSKAESDIKTLQDNALEMDTELDNLGTDLFELDKTVVDIQGDIISINENIVNLQDNKANKSEVFTKSETTSAIETAIAAVDHLKRTVVSSTETIDKDAIDAEQYIYMVPNSDDAYDEYMIIDGELEKVGDWKTDLSGYVTKENLNNTITDLNTVINKKADIVYYPVKNEETNEISQVPGAFLSPEDKEKLSALVIDKDGNVGISGSVNANNVEGLGTWITENANDYITNLTENNLDQNVIDKLNYITTVDENNFSVKQGKLNLVAINKKQVTGLEDELDSKASSTEVNLISTNVGNLNNILNGYTDTDGQPVEGLISIVSNLSSKINSFENNYVTKIVFNSTVGDLNTLITTNKNNIDTLTSDVSILKEHLTWQDIVE